ncbi:mechanosensitive ion channel domain-containing protein [Haliangium sp.]|uniref:mechanosensitive ion channel family protein n=1 Tax=Haliangium sp. TaxID=2663208 RepID=UPI003D0EDA86
MTRSRIVILSVLTALLAPAGAWAQAGPATPTGANPPPAGAQPGSAPASPAPNAGGAPSGTEAGTVGNEAQPPAPIAEETAQGKTPELTGATTEDAAAANTASPARAKPGPGADAEVALPAPEAEARGTCRTPRQAWLQLLYWLQKGEGRWDPAKAAACFAPAGLGPLEAGERAAMLKEILDAKNAWLEIDDIPTNPAYRDNQSGTYRYVDPVVLERVGPEVYLLREPGTGRWLFSADSIAAIPELYPHTLKRLQDHLPSWSKFIFLGIELWKYGSILVLLVLAWVVKRLVVLLLHRYLSRLIKHAKLSYLERFVERARGPIGGLAMAVVFSLALPYLLLPAQATGAFEFAIALLATFSAVWLGYRLIDVLDDYLQAKAERTDSKLDDQLVPLICKTLKFFTIVIGGIFILQNRGVNVASLLAGLGIGGLAVALAAKDTLANFFGSVMIFIDKPFQIGDWVTVGSTEGVIEEVGFRTSRVRTFYNSLVTVPNAMVTNSVVDNYGARKYRRYKANLGLAYDTPPEKMEAFCEGLRALIARTPGMRKDFYLVEFTGFGASSLEILVYSFMETPTWNEELRVRTNLNLDILRLAKELGVSFAFPTQTLHVSSLPQLGQSIPSHSGPRETDELAAVVNGFGPGGERGHPRGLTISDNYDCDAPRTRGSTGE